MDAELSTDLEIVENEGDITYRVNNNKIQGFIDGKEALRQSIAKVLSTEKYEHPIYSFEYGIELDDLVGQDSSYVKIELKRRITECLLQDDRVSSVENFRFTSDGENLLCVFDVISIYGEIEASKEVNI